jgi:hypothetical protein
VALRRVHWAIRVVWISFRPSEPETWVRILHRPLFVRLSAPAGDWPRVSLRCSPMVAVQPVGCIARSHNSMVLPRATGHWFPLVASVGCGPTRRLHRPLCSTPCAHAGDWPRVSLGWPPVAAVQPVGCIARSVRRLVLTRASGRGLHDAERCCRWSRPLAASPSPIKRRGSSVHGHSLPIWNSGRRLHLNRGIPSIARAAT